MFNFNALAKYNPMQTAEAARMGRADRRQIQQQNALAQAGKSYMDGDYKGAAGALMPYDMGAGIQMAQYGQQQQQLQAQKADAAKTKALEDKLALTDNLRSIPMERRAEFLFDRWDSFAPHFGNMDVMTFLEQAQRQDALSDQSLNEDLIDLRSQLGMGAPEMPEAHSQDPFTDPAKIQADLAAGFLTSEQAQKAMEALYADGGGAGAPRVQSTFIDEKG